MGFFSSFKDAVNGDEDDGGAYGVAGKQVVCPHCGSRAFDRSQAQLNTAGMTLLGIDWANRSADTLICRTCGRIEWFLDGVGE